MKHKPSRLVVFGSICAFLLAAAVPARAQQNDGKLETAIRELAADVANYLKNRARVDEVAVGAFRAADPQFASSFGAEIKRLLGEELKNHQVRYDFEQKSNARFTCVGEYAYFPDSGKVTIDVTLKEGKFERAACSKELFDVSDVAALMGGAGRLSIDPERRQESLVAAIDDPQATILTSFVPGGGGGGIPARVAVAQNAEYAVEIWRLKPNSVGKRNPTDEDYEPVPITDEGDGLLFAGLEKDNIYAVRLFNNTDRLAAATVNIDGLNMFAFSEVPGYRALGKVLVPPRAERPEGVLFKGWHRTNADSFAFQVCDVGESAVVELQGDGPHIDDQVGVFTVRFAAAADLSKGETLPPGEPKSASLATKKGPLVGQAYVERDVHIGLDREVISIRYSHPLP